MPRVNRKSPHLKSGHADAELSSKVKELRAGLGYSQRILAETLHVSRSQVVEWENGVSERPSTDRLIEMAKICPSRTLRKWFWSRAGFDLESVKSDFQVEISSPMVSTQPILNVPMLTDRGLSWDELIRESPDGELSFPASLLVHPQSAVCLRLSGQPPWFTENTPAVIVDRTADDPEELVKKHIVVFFDRLPFHLRRPIADYDMEANTIEWMRKVLKERSRRAAGRSASSLEEDEKPGLLTGQLDLQFIDELPISQGDSRLWRVVLHTWNIQNTPESRDIPLSDWQTSGPKSETGVMLRSILRSGVHIYGRILIWISPELLDQSLP